MKILMLTDRMEAGGAETHIAQLTLGLKKLGIDISVLSSGGALADELEKHGIRQYRVPIHTHNMIRLLSLRRYIYKLIKRERFDILHAHARIPALLLRGCQKLGATSIVSVHALFRHNTWLSRICYWGEHTIAVSEDLRAYVCDVYGVPAERVRVIPNGIDCTSFHPEEERSLPPAPCILFASRLDADCSLGAELLCKIAPSLCKHYPGVSIRIAGGGSEYQYIRILAEQVNRTLGRTAVTMLGWVQDMPALLREQDIFIGVSRAAMEAAASGCAVILCGNEGYLGIPEGATLREAILTNFCARGSTVPDSALLEEDLSHLLNSPALRRRIAAEMGSLMQERFSAARMCQETLALYRRVLPTKKEFHVTVGGYFGCGNMGDDAILLGLLEGFRSIAPDVGITVLSERPYRNSRRFGVPCISRRNPFSVCRAFLRSDALLLGGGSLLQNITSSRSLYYYLWLMQLARLFRCPILLCAAGIGPLLGKAACMRVRDMLNRCRYISLRDGDSMRLLRSLGTDASLLHEGADPALLMPSFPPERAELILRESGVPKNKKYLCAVLHGGRENQSIREIILSSVRLLCMRHTLFPLFLIFDPCQDALQTEVARKAVGGCIVSLREPSDAAAILSVSEGLITMRLHAMIFAASVGIPSVGIPADVRDNKILSFAKSVGADCISPDELSVAYLVERTEAALASRASLTPIFSDSIFEMRKKAQKDLANITKMIYNKNQKKD